MNKQGRVISFSQMNGNRFEGFQGEAEILSYKSAITSSPSFISSAIQSIGTMIGWTLKPKNPFQTQDAYNAYAADVTAAATRVYKDQVVQRAKDLIASGTKTVNYGFNTELTNDVQAEINRQLANTPQAIAAKAAADAAAAKQAADILAQQKAASLASAIKVQPIVSAPAAPAAISVFTPPAIVPEPPKVATVIASSGSNVPAPTPLPAPAALPVASGVIQTKVNSTQKAAAKFIAPIHPMLYYGLIKRRGTK